MLYTFLKQQGGSLMENQSRPGEKLTITSMVLSITACILLVITYLDTKDLYTYGQMQYIIITIPAFLFGFASIIMTNISRKRGYLCGLSSAAIIISWVATLIGWLFSLSILLLIKQHAVTLSSIFS